MAACSSAGLSRTAATARFTSSAIVFAELLVLALALSSSLALASVVGLDLGLWFESVLILMFRLVDIHRINRC